MVPATGEMIFQHGLKHVPVEQITLANTLAGQRIVREIPKRFAKPAA
jgi:hypothetical protein